MHVSFLLLGQTKVETNRCIFCKAMHNSTTVLKELSLIFYIRRFIYIYIDNPQFLKCPLCKLDHCSGLSEVSDRNSVQPIVVNWEARLQWRTVMKKIQKLYFNCTIYDAAGKVILFIHSLHLFSIRLWPTHF